jgi:hypothetical protein
MEQSYMPVSGWRVRTIKSTVTLPKLLPGRAVIRGAVNFTYGSHGERDLYASIQGECRFKDSTLATMLELSGINYREVKLSAEQTQRLDGAFELSSMFEFTIQVGTMTMTMVPVGVTLPDRGWVECSPKAYGPQFKMSVDNFIIHPVSKFALPVGQNIDTDTGEVKQPEPMRPIEDDLNW